MEMEDINNFVQQKDLKIKKEAVKVKKALRETVELEGLNLKVL